MYEAIGIFFAGFVTGTAAACSCIRYGFKLGAQSLYEQKESLPPGAKAVEMEQSNTVEYEE